MSAFDKYSEHEISVLMEGVLPYFDVAPDYRAPWHSRICTNPCGEGKEITHMSKELYDGYKSDLEELNSVMPEYFLEINSASKSCRNDILYNDESSSYRSWYDRRISKGIYLAFVLELELSKIPLYINSYDENVSKFAKRRLLVGK